MSRPTCSFYETSKNVNIFMYIRAASQISIIIIIIIMPFRIPLDNEIAHIAERLFTSIINQLFSCLSSHDSMARLYRRNYIVFLNELFRDRPRRLVSPSCLNARNTILILRVKGANVICVICTPSL